MVIASAHTNLSADVVVGSLFDALESAGLGCTIILAHPDRLERVYANAPLAAIYGVDLPTMRAMPVLDALSPGEAERFAAMRSRIRAGAEAPLFVETTVVRPDGVGVPVGLSLGYTMMGETRAVFLFMRDLRQEQAIAQALRESEDRFRTLAESSPDSITITKAGRYVYANPVARRYLGISADHDVTTIDPVAAVPVERRAEISANAARLRAGEKLPPIVVRPIPGVVVEIQLAFITLGGSEAIVSWGRDITERTRLQAELMRQGSLATVGLLAAGVAHELNNPLAAVRMQVKKLRDEATRRALDEDLRASIALIDDASQRMSTIISDLLFVTRPSAHPQAHVDVARILESSVALVRAGVPDCPPITMELEPLPPVMGYASKIGQVFLNVLRNAVEARATTIRVKASATASALTVTISDDGPGIPAEVLGRVTEPFFTTKTNGTGLGLWISHAVLAEQGGRLTLESPPNEGATVTMTLRV